LDHGKEFDNIRIKKFCCENGIKKEYSPPYNPESNGIVRRFNQTIISITKTLIFWSKICDNLWDYAITYANLIYNKMSHSGIVNKIPDKVHYKKKVDIKYLRVWGCITY